MIDPAQIEEIRRAASELAQYADNMDAMSNERAGALLGQINDGIDTLLAALDEALAENEKLTNALLVSQDAARDLAVRNATLDALIEPFRTLPLPCQGLNREATHKLAYAIEGLLKARP